MKFGSVPLEEAQGAVLVHSVRLPDGAVKKGTLLGPSEIATLRAGAVKSVVVARLDPGDVGEDEAAGRLAAAVSGASVRVDKPFTGRSNLYSEAAGVLVVDAAAIDAVNSIDEAITVATLPAWKAVQPGEMIGTVKMIPFAVPGVLLERSVAVLRGPAISVAPFRPMKVGVVSTLLPGLKPSVVRKTVKALAARLAPAGATIAADMETPHDEAPLTDAIMTLVGGDADLVVVFGASAITDRRDVIPAAIERAGGRIEHFGMPVDPGNLMLVGEVAGKTVLGAPGCARSPRENGFDWILQRLLAGILVRREDIMRMGVGGLLMEIVLRGQLRSGEEGGGPEAEEGE
jgi:molybdenum cofactor cytidylyltransferase